MTPAPEVVRRRCSLAGSPRAFSDAHPGVVPVVKGNGYGFGMARLAEQVTPLGLDTIAVGTYHEVAAATEHFAGSVMVLSPWRPFETAASFGSRVVHTVSRLDDLAALAALAVPTTGPPRRSRPCVVTASIRPGWPAAGAAAVRAWAFEGWALHLPTRLRHHRGGGHPLARRARETWPTARCG